jgi:hypothetical protein
MRIRGFGPTIRASAVHLSEPPEKHLMPGVWLAVKVIMAFVVLGFAYRGMVA